MEKLSRVRKISLKSIFPGGSNGGEAYDWTPSLFNNEQGILDDLISCVGINIEPVEREYKVWSQKSIDIYGTNLDTGNKVIIENQFGCTDDSHFARLFAYYYSGITKLNKLVDTVIWIVEDANDIFIEAINNLNDHYEETNFFIVKMYCEEDINTHQKYAKYTILAGPNNLVKEEKKELKSDESEQIYISFWKYFREKIMQHGEIEVPGLCKEFNNKGYPEKWCVCPWQINGDHLKHYIGLKCTNKKLQVIYGVDTKDDPSIMQKINEYANRTNLSTTNKHLIIAEDSSNEYSIHNKNQWDYICNWFISNIPNIKIHIDNINDKL